MIVVVDTNVLIGEVLRASGRRMLEHPRLVLFQADVTADETRHELGRRLDRLAAAVRAAKAHASVMVGSVIGAGVTI